LEEDLKAVSCLFSHPPECLTLYIQPRPTGSQEKDLSVVVDYLYLLLGLVNKTMASEVCVLQALQVHLTPEVIPGERSQHSTLKPVVTLQGAEETVKKQ
jgi:hypothetical protein